MKKMTLNSLLLVLGINIAAQAMDNGYQLLYPELLIQRAPTPQPYTPPPVYELHDVTQHSSRLEQLRAQVEAKQGELERLRNDNTQIESQTHELQKKQFVKKMYIFWYTLFPTDVIATSINCGVGVSALLTQQFSSHWPGVKILESGVANLLIFFGGGYLDEHLREIESNT